MSKLRINELESLETGRSLKVDEMAQTFDYEAGIKITSYSQMVRDGSGDFWQVSGQVALPYVIIGSGLPEGDALVPAGDAVLRQDLANPDKGAAMAARGVVAVDSIDDLLALTEGQRKEGLRYLVKGYHAGSDVGGGEFYWDASRTAENDGGVVIAGWIRRLDGFVSPEMFGATSSADSSSEWISADNTGLPISPTLESYVFDNTVTIASSSYIGGRGPVTIDVKEDINGLVIQKEGCLIEQIFLVKRGDLTTSGHAISLLKVAADGVKINKCGFTGQYSGVYAESIRRLSVTNCTFSHGVYMIHTAQCSDVSISGNYFTKGRTKSTGVFAPVEGDGIKISGSTPFNTNFAITNNVFFDVYRDAVDAYYGGRNLVISGNVLYRFGAKAFDIKTRAQDTAASPDGEPICKDILISGNYIFDDQDRSELPNDEAAVVLSTITPWMGSPIEWPTTLPEVRELGINNVVFEGNVVQTNHPAFVSTTSCYGVRISNNTFLPVSPTVMRVLWNANAYYTVFDNNVVNPLLADQLMTITQGSHQIIKNNVLNRVSILLNGKNDYISGNKFDLGALNPQAVSVQGEGATVTNNEISGATTTGIALGVSATKCAVKDNIIRQSARAVYGEAGTTGAGNAVINNLSLDSGGAFSNLTVVTDNGGAVSGNVVV